MRAPVINVLYLRTHHAAGDTTSVASLLINLDSINIQSSNPKTRPKRSPSPPKRKRNSSQSLSPSQGYGNQDQLHHQHHPPPQGQQQQGLEHNGQTTRHSHRRHSHGDTDDHFLDPGKRQHNHPAHGSSHYDTPDTFTISSSSEPIATVRSSRRDKHLHSSIPNTFWPPG